MNSLATTFSMFHFASTALRQSSRVVSRGACWLLEHLIDHLLGIWTLLKWVVCRTPECLLEKTFRALELGQFVGDSLHSRLNCVPPVSTVAAVNMRVVSFRDSPACCPSRMETGRQTALCFKF